MTALTLPLLRRSTPLAELRNRLVAARAHRDFERAYLGAEPRVQAEMLAAATRRR